MRPLALLIVAATAVAGGCSWLKTGEQSPPPRFTGPIPKKEPAELVAYLNRQAETLRSVSYSDVRATASVNGKEEGSLNDSSLFAAQPRYVRLLGGHTLAGKMLDAGSNDREFWLYMKPVDGDNFFYCSHDDFARGSAKLPVPFDPDWVMMALGMTSVDPAAEMYAVPNEKEGAYLLHQKSTTRQGQTVTKTTVFNVDAENGRRPAVRGHVIYDANRKVIAQAEVKAVKTVATTDPAGQRTTVQVPTQLVLEWPQQGFKMDLRLGDERVNESIDVARTQELFGRPKISGTNPIDLATYTFRPTARGQAPTESRWFPLLRRR